MSNALARICVKTVLYTTLAQKILCAQNPHFLKLGQFQTDLLNLISTSTGAWGPWIYYLLENIMYAVSLMVGKGKGKSVPLKSWSGSEGSRKVRFPDLWQLHRMVVGCEPYVPAAFTPRKYSWYPFLLEAESTPGP